MCTISLICISGARTHAKLNTTTFFRGLLDHLRFQQPILSGTAFVAILGDIFEDKRALDPYAEKTFVWLIRELAQLAPVVMIPGNHDFQQTEPHRPDRIAHALEVMTTCGALPHEVCYLRDTGAYRVGNVCVCTVSVYDTLSSTSGSGNVDSLPPFPRADSDPGADFSLALAHATVRKRAPQAGSPSSELAHGCSLDWFRKAGHTMVLLGDEHTPRTWNVDGMLVAQPGSILTQTFGEPVQGHGLCEWDMAARAVTNSELSNPYAGVSAVRASDGAVQFWASGRASRLHPLSVADAKALPWFPSRPRVRLIGGVTKDDVLRALKSPGPKIHPVDFVEDPVASAEEFVRSMAQVDGGNASSDGDLREYASGERMAEYLRERESDPAAADEMVRIVLDPMRHLTLPAYELAPTSVTEALIKHQAGRSGSKGAKIQSYVDKSLDDYHNAKPPPTVRARVTRFEASWMGPYERVDIDFTSLSLTTLVDGPNGSGKSSLLDALKLGIFGTVEEARCEFSNVKYRMQHQSKPSSAAAKTRVHVQIEWAGGLEDNEIGVFIIERDFLPSRQRSDHLVPRVSRACGTSVVNGCKKVADWVGERLGTPGDVSKCGVLAQSNGSSFVRMRTTATDKAEGRQGLIERHLALDKNQHLADAIEASVKGLDEARKACEAAISDKHRPDLEPRPVLSESLDTARATILATRATRSNVDAAADSEVESIRDIASAKRAHESAPADENTLSETLRAAEAGLLEAPPLEADDAAELNALPERIHTLDLQVASMGAEPDSLATEVAAAHEHVAQTEAMYFRENQPPAAQEDILLRLKDARDFLETARGAATAILEPQVERRTIDKLGGDEEPYSRADIEDLQLKIRALDARTDPTLFEEWLAEEQAWNALVAYVGAVTPIEAQSMLDDACALAELRMDEKRVAEELSSFDKLSFDKACSTCIANRDALACDTLSAELVAIRSNISRVQEHAFEVDAAKELVQKAREVEARRTLMAQRAERWDKVQANDSELSLLETRLCHNWWAAFDVQKARCAQAQETEKTVLATIGAVRDRRRCSGKASGVN